MTGMQQVEFKVLAENHRFR